MAKGWARAVVAGVAGVSLMLSTGSANAREPVPTTTAVPGKPTLLIAGFDLGTLGYRTDEFFLPGTAPGEST